MSELSDWLTVWPLITTAIAAAGCVMAWGRERLQSALAVGGVAAQFGVSTLLFLKVWTDGPVSMAMGGWPAPFGVAFVADAFGAGLTVAASGTALTILVYGTSTKKSERRHAGFSPLLLVLMTGVAGAFLTQDVFNLYVWFEVTLITALGMLVVGGTREQLDGALKYAIPNLLATTLLLIAISIMYGMTGTLNMGELADKIATLPDSAALQTVGMLFLISLAVKSALFPLSFWLPASYHTAGATVAAVFGALLTKVGVYAIIRVFVTIFADTPLVARDVMVWAAALTMVFAALGMLAENDIRRWVSFSVLSSAGFMVIGVAIGSEQGVMGGVFYIVHSIVLTAALFMASGLIVNQGRTPKLSELSGLVKSQPVLAAVFLGLGLSLAGVPPFTGFWPKVYLIQAGLAAENYGAVAAIVVSGFITLVVVGRTFALVFWRTDDVSPLDASDSTAVVSAAPAPPRMTAKWALVGLATLSLFLGAAPEPLLAFAVRSTGTLVGGIPR